MVAAKAWVANGMDGWVVPKVWVANGRRNENQIVEVREVSQGEVM